jgi:hypothetical protein
VGRLKGLRQQVSTEGGQLDLFARPVAVAKTVLPIVSDGPVFESFKVDEVAAAEEAVAEEVVEEESGDDPGIVLLKRAIRENELMVFLWGMNPHFCTVRLGNGKDDTEPACLQFVRRVEAEALLDAAGYTFHNYHETGIGPGFVKSKVYRRPR